MKFYLPTKIFRSENAIFHNSTDFLLGKRAFIVTGKTSGRMSGALEDVEDVFKKNNVEYCIWDKINNNPTVEECELAGREAENFKADFVVGIGGGSPLDAAKAVAVYAVNPNVKGTQIYNCKYDNKPLPMVAVPTTAGTGSEVTPYSVLTLNSEETKRSFSTPDTFYRSAFLDPRYTKNLPLQITRNTAIDALSHLVEGYTNNRSTQMTDYIAVEGMRIIGTKLKLLADGKLSLEDRDQLLWASALGGIVISQTGTTIVHAMGYPLTYYKDIPHGMANGLLLGGYLEHAQSAIDQKVSTVLSLLGFDSTEELDSFMKSILPRPCEFDKKELHSWAEKTAKSKNSKTCPFEVTVGKEAEIFEKALL